MTSLSTKVTIQSKVAELESRITVLEDQIEKLQCHTAIHVCTNEKFFGDGWKKMWQGFDEVMNSVFKAGRSR